MSNPFNLTYFIIMAPRPASPGLGAWNVNPDNGRVDIPLIDLNRQPWALDLNRQIERYNRIIPNNTNGRSLGISTDGNARYPAIIPGPRLGNAGARVEIDVVWGIERVNQTESGVTGPHSPLLPENNDCVTQGDTNVTGNYINLILQKCVLPVSDSQLFGFEPATGSGSGSGPTTSTVISTTATGSIPSFASISTNTASVGSSFEALAI